MWGGESLVGALWYLIAMLEFTVIYAILQYILHKIIMRKIFKECIALLCFSLLLCIGYSNIQLPRMMNSALILLFYYHAGHIINRIFKDQVQCKLRSGQGSILMLFSLICLLYGAANDLRWDVFSNVTVVVSCAGIYLMLYLAAWIKKIPFICDRLLYTGRHTMIILALHFLCFKLVSLIYIVLQRGSLSGLAEFPILNEVSFLWKVLYSLCGVLIPLAISAGIIKGRFMLSSRTIS